MDQAVPNINNEYLPRKKYNVGTLLPEGQY